MYSYSDSVHERAGQKSAMSTSHNMQRFLVGNDSCDAFVRGLFDKPSSTRINSPTGGVITKTQPRSYNTQKIDSDLVR
jgi:hypothetical protein